MNTLKHTLSSLLLFFLWFIWIHSVQADDSPFITITAPESYTLLPSGENVVVKGETLPNSEIKIVLYSYSDEQELITQSDASGIYSQNLGILPDGEHSLDVMIVWWEENEYSPSEYVYFIVGHLDIITPENDATIYSSTVTVSGHTLPDYRLEIYLDDEEYYEMTYSDEDGNYSIELSDISLGEHVISVWLCPEWCFAWEEVYFTVEEAFIKITAPEYDEIFSTTDTITIVGETLPNSDVRIKITNKTFGTDEEPIYTTSDEEGIFSIDTNFPYGHYYIDAQLLWPDEDLLHCGDQYFYVVFITMETPSENEIVLPEPVTITGNTWPNEEVRIYIDQETDPEHATTSFVTNSDENGDYTLEIPTLSEGWHMVIAQLCLYEWDWCMTETQQRDFYVAHLTLTYPEDGQIFYFVEDSENPEPPENTSEVPLPDMPADTVYVEWYTLPNFPVTIILNDATLFEGETDWDGYYSIPIHGLKYGANTLRAEIDISEPYDLYPIPILM